MMVSSIFEAVDNGDLVQLQKNIAFKKFSDDDWTDYELLIASLNQDNKDVIKLLLNNGCRVQHTSKNHFIDSPLYHAILKQDEDILELLLKQVSLTSIDYKSESVFESVLKSPRNKIKLILKVYAEKSINPSDYDGFTPFHLACYIGDVNLVKQFLSFVNDPDCCIHASAQSFAGYSALHCAVDSKCPEVVELLLQVFGYVTIKRPTDQSPFSLSCKKRIEPIIDVFIKVYSQNNAECKQDKAFAVLHKYLIEKDLAFCSTLIKSDDDLWKSWTCLHFAVARQKKQLVKFILENADANLIHMADKYGLSALHLACQCSFIEQLDSTDSDHQQKLEEKTEAIEILEMLLRKGCNVNAKDHYDRTPLLHVLETLKSLDRLGMSQSAISNLIGLGLRLVQLLEEYQARVDLADKNGTTVLHLLSHRDSIFEEDDKIKLAQRFLSMGADVNAKTRQSVTALFMSIRNRLMGLAALYIEANADVNCACTHSNKFSPLHALAYYNEYSYESTCLLRQLLEHGAEVNAAEIDKATALHIVIDCHGLQANVLEVLGDRDQMASALLDYGASVDALDKHGQTPLHRACLNRYGKGALVLLERGADVNLEDDFGQTALGYAGYRLSQEADPSFLQLVRHHVHKLKFIGCLQVSDKCQQDLRQLEKLYGRRFQLPRIDRGFLQSCAKELDNMRACKLDVYTGLYDILLKSTNDMSRHAKNQQFASIALASNLHFPIYGYLLQLQYQRGLRRGKLMQAAETALKALSHCQLPDTIVSLIFDRLSDSDLQCLIQAHFTPSFY